MKTVFVLLVCVNVLFAQIPSPKGDISTQSLPVLQEWWRADNMGYGIAYNGGNGGMTWLENFYHGKGALVISTPTGVKTWQLRYPGDTVNVFTWQGNAPWGDYKSPNPIIKTLDINGDKVTDYIDGVGNLYYGTQNGEPPNPKPSFYGLTPVFISDINNDTYDDALSWNISSSQDSIIAYILYGAKEANNITIDSVKLPTELYSNTDRTVQPINIYKTPNGEIRIILRYRIMGKEDGYKLYGFTKTQNNYVFELKDSYIASTTNDYSYQGYNTIINNQINLQFHWVVTESLDGNMFRTNLVYYNLSNDKFIKILTQRQDSIGTLNVLKYSINKDEYSDWFLQHYVNEQNIEKIFYSGNLQEGLKPIAKFTSLSSFPYSIITSSDLNKDSINDIIMCSQYFDENRFYILNGISPTVDINLQEEYTKIGFDFDILNHTGINQNSVLKVKYTIHQSSIVIWRLYTLDGKLINSNSVGQQDIGEHMLEVSLSKSVPASGIYYLVIEQNGRTSIKQFIIE